MMLVHHLVTELNTMTLPLDAPPGVEPGLNKVLGWVKWIAYSVCTLGILIAGGTANIQRNIIAERGLGMPRDPSQKR
jgi:hypothetical protein